MASNIYSTASIGLRRSLHHISRSQPLSTPCAAAETLCQNRASGTRSISSFKPLQAEAPPAPRYSFNNGQRRTPNPTTERSTTSPAESTNNNTTTTSRPAPITKPASTGTTGGPPYPRTPPPETNRNLEAATSSPQEPIRELATEGLSDLPSEPNIPADTSPDQVDWTRSFHGLSSSPFSKEAGDILMQPLNPEDIEIKPDGIVYLPEIKYRRILNRAFGPGGWGLAPRGETIVTGKSVTREYALLAQGRLVSIARGEQDYFDPEGIPTATEGCKSNALMRCCKDLGVASELWDPRFIRGYLANYAKEVWVEHAVTKKRKRITMRKDDEVRYPHKEVKMGAAGGGGGAMG